MMSGVRGLAGLIGMAILVGCTQDPYREHRVPGGDPEIGEVAIRKYGCEYCHVIPGIDDDPTIEGPPLTAWAERRYIAGALPNEPEPLILWIMDPHAVEPGTAMPNLGVSEEEARHIAAYLYTIEEGIPPAPVDFYPELY